jgi:hypothetical protein
VRADSDAAASALRRMLARYVRDDREPQANFSVRFAPAVGRRGVTGLHLVYRAGNLVGRYRQRAAAVDALLARLAELVVDDTAVLRVAATALVADGAATLVPRRTLDRLPALAPHLARVGVEALPGRAVSVDPTTLEVLAPPPLAIDVAGYRALADADPAAHPQRRSLRRWVLPDPVLPSRGATVLRCAALVENRRTVGGRRTLDAVAACADLVRPRPDATVSAWVDALV